MTAKFTDDLQFGQAAEAQFHMLHPALVRTDGRKGDFTNSKGEIVELKTDRYSHDKTLNFFMERYSFSDVDGGPFQARNNGVKWYAYMYASGGQLYVFDVQELCEFIDRRYAERDLIKVVNETHITRGYKVPREQLVHLLVEPEVALT